MRVNPKRTSFLAPQPNFILKLFLVDVGPPSNLEIALRKPGDCHDRHGQGFMDAKLEAGAFPLY
jgi:hypothetical protein